MRRVGRKEQGVRSTSYDRKAILPKRTEAKCLLGTAEKISVTVALAECYMIGETDEVRIRLMRNCL